MSSLSSEPGDRWCVLAKRLLETSKQLANKCSKIKIIAHTIAKTIVHLCSYLCFSVSFACQTNNDQSTPAGNVSDITFSNIKIETRYYDPSWWGRAEPVYITTCPRDPTSKVGSISDLRFINISAVSENGVFLSGSEGGLLSNLKFVNVNLTYRRWTHFSDGLFDYRPGCQGMVHHSTAGIMMEHVSGLDVENVKMKWHMNSWRGWNNPMEFRPSTVNKLSFRDWSSEEY